MAEVSSALASMKIRHIPVENEAVVKATELLKNAKEILYTMKKEAADPRLAKLGFLLIFIHFFV